MPKTDNALPRRRNERTLIALPMEAKSRMLSEEPSRAHP
jgi:hypothetical protein